MWVALLESSHLSIGIDKAEVFVVVAVVVVLEPNVGLGLVESMKGESFVVDKLVVVAAGERLVASVVPVLRISIAAVKNEQLVAQRSQEQSTCHWRNYLRLLWKRNSDRKPV